MEAFTQGLYVTAFGMGLVFVSLGLIMLSIWGMERLFRVQEQPAEERPVPKRALANDGHDLTEEEEVAAVIGVALALALEEERQREQGKWAGAVSANGSASMWTAQGRQYLMNSRYVVKETRR